MGRARLLEQMEPGEPQRAEVPDEPCGESPVKPRHLCPTLRRGWLLGPAGARDRQGSDRRVLHSAHCQHLWKSRPWLGLGPVCFQKQSRLSSFPGGKKIILNPKCLYLPHVLWVSSICGLKLHTKQTYRLEKFPQYLFASKNDALFHTAM